MQPYLSLRLPTICLALVLVVWTCTGWSPAAQSGQAEPAAPSAQKQAKTPESGSGDPVPASNADEKTVVPQITEEITVTATVTPELPVSSISRIDRRLIDTVARKDISEALSYTSGTFVSTGSKNEPGIRIRGLDTSKISLFVDGVPVAEPYFNSFSLGTVPIQSLDSIRVVKGASSVLYGANALGGVIDVTTERPDRTALRVNGTFGTDGLATVGVSGTARSEQTAFVGSFYYDRSDEYSYLVDGERTDRFLSDYERYGFNGKFYFFPSAGSEVVAEVDWYDSEYGVPPATAYSKARYWRFSDWNRLITSLGGTFALGGHGYLKAKGFYTRHFNVLDAYRKANLAELQWVSTYNNETYGAILSGAVAPTDAHDLRFSVSYRDDRVKQQGDKGDPWEEYNHKTFSTGIEDHFQIADHWTLVGGVSLDYLDKDFGDNDTAVNPIAGILYSPDDVWDVHLTIAQKSRFPSMKNLYSTSGGNPDLRDERGTNTELGAAWRGPVNISGAVFFNRIKDLIESVRLPSGYKTNINVGNARIAGFEVSAAAPWSIFDFNVNYTFLDGENMDTDADLDLTPHHQLNAVVRAMPGGGWTVSAWGLAVSRATVHVTDLVVPAPGYLVLNAEVAKQFKSFQVFARVENLLDQAYSTEPGFPMPARSFQAGLRFDYDFTR